MSRSIISYYDTQIVGEIDISLGNMPVIMPTSDFKGNGVFDTDVYLADGKTQWYLNTVSFYYLIRVANLQLITYTIAGKFLSTASQLQH